jgi:hypothetical protein
VIWGNGGHWVLKCDGFWGLLVALLGVDGVVVASIVCGMLLTFSDVPVVCGILLADLMVDALIEFSCVGICLVVGRISSCTIVLSIYISTHFFLRSTELVRPYCSKSKVKVTSQLTAYRQSVRLNLQAT